MLSGVGYVDTSQMKGSQSLFAYWLQYGCDSLIYNLMLTYFIIQLIINANKDQL